MSVLRLVRIGVAGAFVMLCTAAPVAAVTMADAGNAAATTATTKTTAARSDIQGAAKAAHPQATALISPRFGEVVRPDASELARTQMVANRVAGAGAGDANPTELRQDAMARADDEAADMAHLEIVALIGAALIAVLSLSRRRNL